MILAARALGLDAGALSGFDAKHVNETFFNDSTWTVNFIINLARGDTTRLYDRLLRFDFDQACTLL